MRHRWSRTMATSSISLVLLLTEKLLGVQQINILLNMPCSRVGSTVWHCLCLGSATLAYINLSNTEQRCMGQAIWWPMHDWLDRMHQQCNPSRAKSLSHVQMGHPQLYFSAASSSSVAGRQAPNLASNSVSLTDGRRMRCWSGEG